MALVLFLKFGILFQIIGLYWLKNGPQLSVNAVANVEIPGPHIRFIQHPPPTAIISQNNEALFLSCIASVNNMTINNSSQYSFEFYSWLRNGKKISQNGRNKFEIFENGTLKVPTSEKLKGKYRCIANGTEIGLGALISTECNVNIAVLKRLENGKNIEAIIGMPTVLNCPILSVPKANITWYIGNKNTPIQSSGSRYFLLQNGSLLIESVKQEDSGEYICSARNIFVTKQQRQANINITAVSSSNYIRPTGIINIIEEENHFVKVMENLKLHCASYSENVDWYFTSLNSNISKNILNNSKELEIKNATLDLHDGYYKCVTSTGSSQKFKVTVLTPPVIIQQLPSLQSSLAATVQFHCNASGNPLPKITWYKNGKLLKNSYTVYYSPPTLRIYSFDLKDEGIYQCFAENLAGEVVTSGSLELRRKEDLANLPRRPENVACFPVNYKTVYVTFDSRPSLLFMMNLNIVTENPFKWNSTLPVQLLTNSSLTIGENLPILKPFILFMRGLVRTSTQFFNGFEEHTFDVSLLSDGIKCATQGLNIKAIFLHNGIFLWWTPIPSSNIKEFILQFWNNNNASATVFSDKIIGTKKPLDTYQTPKKLETQLDKIPVLTKTYFGDDMIKETINIQNLNNIEIKSSEKPNNENTEETITEVRTPGSVTGILIPNTHKVTARVFAITEDNEKLNLNIKYVEWRTIESQQKHDYLFRIIQIESRYITLSWDPIENVQCIQACYVNTCQMINASNTYFILKKLKSSTHYHIDFLNCLSTEYLGTVDVTTKADAPGPIVNHTIIKNNGLKLSWEAPINPNGQIFYYNILWTLRNKTNEANVTAGKNFFQFPNITAKDKINITIRAIGSSGIGLPIYMDLRNAGINFLEKDENNSTDQTLGIILGSFLSIICIIIFIWIFLWQRKKFKTKHTITTTPPTTQNFLNVQNPNREHHEMQNLIPRIQNENDIKITDIPIQLQNGNDINCKKIINNSDDNNKECKQIIQNLNRQNFINKQDLNEIFLNENEIKDDIKIHRNYSSPGLSEIKTNINGNMFLHYNGSMKNVLPLVKHSIETKAPEIKSSTNISDKYIDNIKFSDANCNTALMDDSQQKLLTSHLDRYIDKCNDEDPDKNEFDESNTTTNTFISLNDSNNSCNHFNYSIPKEYKKPEVGPNG